MRGPDATWSQHDVIPDIEISRAWVQSRAVRVLLVHTGSEEPQAVRDFQVRYHCPRASLLHLRRSRMPHSYGSNEDSMIPYVSVFVLSPGVAFICARVRPRHAQAPANRSYWQYEESTS